MRRLGTTKPQVSGQVRVATWEARTREPEGAVVVATCEAACDASLGERRRENFRLCPPTLVAAGILTQTACRIQREQTGLRVEFALPIPVSAAVKQALAVRVLDTVRSAGRRPGVRARAGMTFADLAAARGVPSPAAPSRGGGLPGAVVTGGVQVDPPGRRGNDEGRAACPVGDGAGHAPEEQVGGATPAAGADDDEIRVHVVRQVQQGRRGVTGAEDDLHADVVLTDVTRGRLEQLQRLVAHALVALAPVLPSSCYRERSHVLEHMQHAQRAAQHRGDIRCHVERSERCRRTVDAHQQMAQPELVTFPQGPVARLRNDQHRHARFLQHPEARRPQGHRRIGPHAPAPHHQERRTFSCRGGQEDIDGVAIAHLDAMRTRGPQQGRAPGVLHKAAQCRAPRPGRRVRVVPPVQKSQGVHRDDLGAEHPAQLDGPTQRLLRRRRAVDAHNDPTSLHTCSVSAAQSRNQRQRSPMEVTGS
jgi:hypothetical protein